VIQEFECAALFFTSNGWLPLTLFVCLLFFCFAQVLLGGIYAVIVAGLSSFL
jgi:hypothetical protein